MKSPTSISLTTAALASFVGESTTAFSTSSHIRHRRPSSSSSSSSLPSFFGKIFPIDEREREAREEGEEGGGGGGGRDEEECLLIPETDPNSDPNAASLSGVPYAAVVRGIDALYPPRELSDRNARSRTDGYWKYVERGESPPREFTYGEFDVEFFGSLLDGAWGHYLEGTHDGNDGDGDDAKMTSKVPWGNKTFCDIGSGAGRLVLTAAALHPGWKACRGLEILEGLHDMATSTADGGRVEDAEDRQRLGITDDTLHQILCVPRGDGNEEGSVVEYLPSAPVEFACGSFADPYEYLGDVDCAFVFSSCMKPELVKELSVAIGRQCRPGTIVITTEFPLFLRGNVGPSEEEEEDAGGSKEGSGLPHGPYEIQLLEKVDGWCWLLGGASTAYVHRVKTSLWEEYGGPRERPRQSLEEEAFRLVRAMEEGELTDPEEFLRRVRNDMIFHGVPPEFIPRIVEEG